MADHHASSPLISAEQLQNTLNEVNVKVFDVRGQWGDSRADAFAAYEQSHIPGAVFLDATVHFIEPDVPRNLAPVASKENAAAAFQDLGITKDDMVILYDDYDHMFAARIRWAMQYRGFRNVKLLEGGWKNWLRKAFPTASGNIAAAKGAFTPGENEDLQISLQKLIKVKDDVQLIDARGAKNYDGNPDDERSGHIPGAVNIPFRDLLEPGSGLFKDRDALKNLFEEKLPALHEKPIVSSCGSGYAGSVTLIALELLGVSAPLFDDSFAIWKSDPTRLIEKS